MPAPQGQPSAAWNLVFVAWLVASVATLSALFLGEVMGMTPCVLCWYQRIFMFPLALLLAVGLFPFDARVVRYALPLCVLGALVALFHVLLVAGIVPESAQPCRQGVSCRDQPLLLFGFLHLPLLSLLAFSLIGGLLMAARQKSPDR